MLRIKGLPRPPHPVGGVGGTGQDGVNKCSASSGRARQANPRAEKDDDVPFRGRHPLVAVHSERLAVPLLGGRGSPPRRLGRWATPPLDGRNWIMSPSPPDEVGFTHLWGGGDFVG